MGGLDIKRNETGAAILGYGVVGKGVAHAIRQNGNLIEKKTGVAIKLLHILDVLDFPESPDAALITHDAGAVFEDERVRVVVETIGGLGVAYKFTREALSRRKHVVTSNKELVAEYGPELLELARQNNVKYLFDASVGGGIPLMAPVERCLAPNDIDAVTGILNGTTNYMLTYMETHGAPFMETLRKAQEMGYAESNPADDVEGADARRKLAILSSVIWGAYFDWKTIYTEGISRVAPADIEAAADMGRALKLLARIRRFPDGRFEACVLPAMIDRRSLLAGVSGVHNAVVIHGDLTGDVMFYGQGAGMLPTGSAVVSDIIRAAATDAVLAETEAASAAREPGADDVGEADVSGSSGKSGDCDAARRAPDAACMRWDREAAVKPADFSDCVHDFYARIETPDPGAYADLLFGEFTEARILPDAGRGCAGDDGGGNDNDGSGGSDGSGGIGDDDDCGISGGIAGKSGQNLLYSVMFTVPGVREGDFKEKLDRVNAGAPGSAACFIARLL